MLTEAEWEFAARGGMITQDYKYSGSNDINQVAWYKVYHTCDVKTKAPNELGVFDMTANVWEWCEDYYGDYESSAQTNPTGPETGSYRVFRGGAFGIPESYCTITTRSRNESYYKSNSIGFRLAL